MNLKQQARFDAFMAICDGIEQSARHRAINLLIRRLKYSESEACKFVEKLFEALPALNHSARIYVEGIVRWFCDEEIDLNSTEDLIKVNQILKALDQSPAMDALASDFYSEIHNELLSYNQTCDFVGVEPDSSYSVDGSEHSFEVVRIDSYAQLLQYQKYVNKWCIMTSDFVFNKYTFNGTCDLYLALRDDYDRVPAIPGDDTPYDDYGFSIMAVITSPDSDIISITSRWNSNKESDYFISPEQLRELIGESQYNAII